MRNFVLAALFLAPLVSARPAHANADLDAGPLHVDFKIEASEHKGPVASGSMEMEAQEMTRFESELATGKLSLELYSRIHHDGSVGIWANYEEVGSKGEKVKWQPSMQGKRGVPLVATIHAGQFERTITVTIR